MSIVAISFSLLSGLRIASLDKSYLLSITTLLPEGQVHSLHLISGISLLVLSCYYGYFKLSHRTVTTQTRYHKLVTWFGYVIILTSLLSGVLLRLDWLPQPLLPLHYFSALALLLYLLLHSWVYALQLGRNAFKKILFIPLKRFPLRLTGVLILCICVLYYYVQSSTHTLSVSAISADVLMEIDGYDDEPQWQDATLFFVDTNHGANFVDGYAQVAIKALSNGQETFFLFRWADPTQSLNHLPLVKTESGWKVQENGFYHFDEQSYYEDKFAVMLSNSCSFGADGTSYLGKQPFNSSPANWHSKGYHASLDGKIRDLWHWKAVRTNDMVLADDNFIGPLVKPLNAERRYKAGYQTDGKESGSYVMNWQWYSKNQITPKRLPNQNIDISHPVLPWFGSHPYQKAHDTYPIGTQLSSVLYRSNRFEGDRADVRAKGRWHDGYWTLELVRKNKTDSAHDIALSNHTCMWVSAFDRSQIAHTRHQRAIKLRYAL
nr:ethylbenzene dehydrogenase-related protein [Pseudoalteromonas caenipelagi]